MPSKEWVNVLFDEPIKFKIEVEEIDILPGRILIKGNGKFGRNRFPTTFYAEDELETLLRNAYLKIGDFLFISYTGRNKRLIKQYKIEILEKI